MQTQHFADAALGPQSVFRCLLQALAEPGRVCRLPEDLPAPPAGTGGGLYAAALTLIDYETPVWLAPELSALADGLRFHAGAPLTDETARASFALAADGVRLPALADFALGSDSYPDQSTTLLVEVTALTPDSGWTWRGPGIPTARRLGVEGLPFDFLGQWADNYERFPRGVDMYLFCAEGVVGLPRSTRIVED